MVPVDEGREIMTMTAELRDGRSIALSAGEGQRVLYALTSLAVTALGPHLNMARIVAADGDTLWALNDDQPAG